ncbi:bifunctional chorismate mutase/prephenate dehydrogenase [Agaribacter flavus]|uniref:T-protein n=1 Tax=Agaribacter flavus TaxID=1902781 RepID=A0ABV7FKI7_9ALTE
MTDSQQPSLDASLSALREQIDEVDSALVDLLKRRTDITTKVGQLKSKHAKPVYVPERERALIQARREQAEQAGINPDLIEDILRRTFRESYHSQHAEYARVNPNLNRVVVVGGNGALGKVFVNLFAQSSYDVSVLDKDDWDKAESLLADAELVIIAVPINKTESVIDTLPKLPKNCILADITSVKTKPLAAMLRKHSGPVVGLHPMFGPDAPGMIKQVVVVCHGRGQTQYAWFLEQMKLWGASLHISQADTHDKAMSIIQVMRHFSSFVYGLHLCNEDPDINELMAFSSPIYRLELAMVGRLFAQAPELYADIIFENSENVQLLERFIERYTDSTELLKQSDKAKFIAQFKTVSEWFGDYASQCLADSKQMLLKADDSHLLRKK